MAIFIDKNSRIIIQGLTGSQGMKHAYLMSKFGSNIVGGINPKKANKYIKINNKNIKIFGTVSEAVVFTKPNVSIIFVPKIYAKNAIFEAIDANIQLIIIITEGIPVKDMLQCYSFVNFKNKINNKIHIRIIGPNSPGLVSPSEALAGIVPASISNIKGPLGLVSRSGTLTYEFMHKLKNIGFSTAIGIGGDRVIGTNYIDVLKSFNKDSNTKVIIMIGEIGGNEEEKAAIFIKKTIKKPIIAYIAGVCAPIGKVMGHAGALINRDTLAGSAKNKINALKNANVKIGKSLDDTVELVKSILLKNTIQ